MAFSHVTYTGGSGVTEFQIPFEYLSQTHLVVSQDGTPDTNGIEYTINTGTQKVVFGVAPLSGVAVKIQRTTPIATVDRPIDFQGGSGLGEADLDALELTSLFLAQEANDFTTDAATVIYVDAGDATLAASISSTDAANSITDQAYADALDTANSITDQAYADSLVITAGAGDVFIGGGATVDQYIPQWDGNNTKTLKGGYMPLGSGFNFNTASDVNVPTGLAVKKYVDSSINNKNYFNNSGLTVDIENKSAGTTTHGQHVGEGWELTSVGISSSATLSRGNATFRGHYSLEMDCDTTDTPTGTDLLLVTHRLEGYDVASFKFGTSYAEDLVISFWAIGFKAGDYHVIVKNKANDRSYISRYTLVSAVEQFIELPITGDTGGVWDIDNTEGLEVIFVLAAGDSYDHTGLTTWLGGDYRSTPGQVNFLDSTSNYWRITEPKLEISTSATTWVSPDHGTATDKSERYYQVLDAQLQAATATQLGNQTAPSWTYKTGMRVNPTGAVTLGGGSGATFAFGSSSFGQAAANTIQTTFRVELDARL